ncbi:SusC/RagA family TonB-linked outer membrane protein [Pedobacter metabolipauper]|uniref:TonB-linked SusC/RagA family outer membrane protein n=1 Tax=Pedobacter metabolipauper TaxID=425513 RepID=A0A4R6SY76_9SPHI|nr:TonB-dependent receptor [Pedobacter metabolipauper]TDQ09662.1 TonB-linked SusC/RagA family outer membrane protein [Pedobacter metabolipauper]
MEKSLYKHRVIQRVLSFMKYTIAVIMILCGFFTVATATHTYGQKILDNQVSLSLKKVNLKKALDQIAAEAGAKIAYGDGIIDQSIIINQDFDKVKLGKVLERLLFPNDINFSVVDNVVILKRSVQSKFVNKIIQGMVVDSAGIPLPGVSILVKNRRNIGTTTDVDGKYLINIPDDSPTLVFSFVGFVTQEVSVGSRSTLNVILKEVKADLSEVVVVAYGTQKKANVTGSVVSVGTADLLRTPTASLTNSLAGRLPGLTTVQNSGNPGDDGSVLNIRGFGTYQGKDPLVLVDGIENSIDRIDANEVESISLLKDAAATAVFGMKGANGVLLVTTKRGQAGKPVVSLTSQVSVQSPVRLPEYLDSYDALTLFREALNNDNLNANLYTDEYISKFRDRSNPTYQYLYPNVDWHEELLKPNSLMNQTNLNVSGGSATARYFVSMSYLGQDGLYKYDDLNDYNINAYMNKYNFRSNVDINITKHLSLEINLANVVRERNYPNEDTNTFWSELRNTPSYLYPVSNPNGSIPAKKDLPPSPYGRLTQFGYRRLFENTLAAIGGFNLQLPFVTEGLSFRTRFAFDAQSYRDITRQRNYSTYRFTIDENQTDLSKGVYEEMSTGDGLLNFAVSSNASRKSTYEAYLNYDRTFASKHAVTSMIRYNQTQRFTNAGDPIGALPYKQLGLVGRVNYAYDRRYVLGFDAGYNGSENFKGGRRMGFFPAVSASWIVSNESFLENSNVFNLLKLRASFGTVGVDNSVGRFAYLSTWATGGGSGYRFGKDADGNSYSSAQESASGNEFLTWERARKTNIGLDVELFKQTIVFTTDVFQERRTQILTEAKIIPDVSGIQSLPAINAGIVSNKGFETELTWRKVFGRSSAMLRGSYSYATNRIDYAAEPNYKLAYRGMKGTQIFEVQGLTALGLFKDQADIASSPVQQFGAVRPGDIKYLDRNGDGVVNTQDEGYLGEIARPKSIVGLTAAFTFRQFDLNVLFQGAYGGTRWLEGTSAWAFASNSSILSDYLVNRYTDANPNPNASYPKLTSSNNVNNNRRSTYWLRSSNYLRLKNVEIGYTLPTQLIKRVRLSNVRAFANGLNLYTWDKLKIFDPETSDSFGNYPQQRVINFGLRVAM